MYLVLSAYLENQSSFCNFWSYFIRRALMIDEKAFSGSIPNAAYVQNYFLDEKVLL